MLRVTILTAQVDIKDFVHYTLKEGLSDNNVSCISQDDRGFIWIGTEFGLNRYDGAQFENYVQGMPAGFLTSSNIHKVIPFRNNRLAIVTRNGLQVVNTDDFSIKQYSIPDSTTFKTRMNFIIDAAEFDDGSVGVATATGFYEFDLSGQLIFRFDAFRMEDAGNKRILYGKKIITLPDHKAFVYGIEDLQALYDNKQKDFQPIARGDKTWQNFIQPPISGWRSIIQITDHEYLFLTRSDSLIYFNYSSGKHILSKMPEEMHYNLTWESSVFMVNDSTGFINGGFHGFYVVHINRQNGEVRYDDQLALPEFKIKCFYIDLEHRLWIGTTEGLLKQKSTPAFTNVYNWTLDDVSRLGYTSGYRHGDKLYFSRFSRDTGLIVVNPSTMKIENKFCFFSRDNPCNEIFSVEMYYPDTLWLGTNGGLLWFDTKNNQYGKVAELITQAGKSKWIYLNTALPDQNAWMCDLLEGHVARLHIPSRKMVIYDSHSEPVLPFSLVRHICTDYAGNTWIGGQSLSRWNAKSQTFDTLITRYGGPNPDEDEIRFMRSDQKGSLWLHNYGNGLLQYKIESGEWKHFGMNEGLPAEVIQSMSIVYDQSLWLTSQNQLIHFNIENGHLETYDEADGLPAVKPLYGNMFFDSTTHDLFVFYKDYVVELPFNYHREPDAENDLVIEKVEVNGSRSIFFPQKELPLSTKENNLVVRFTIVDFHEGQPYRFAYRITPDENWINLGNQRTLHLTNLAPGKYTMEISATSKAGVKKSKALIFSIAPPFWKTAWFSLIGIGIAALIIYVIYRIRISQVQQKANLDKLLSQTEMKALHAQMNPHFIFNSLNSIREMILNNETREASRFLGNFAHLIRITLDQSRQSFISLRNTMDYLHRYIEMEKIRNPDFHFTMEVDPALEPDDTILPPLLIQPFIENAIWHGMDENGKEVNIHVRFIKQGEHLVCIIEDDGIGIDRSLKRKNEKNGGHKSVSISNVRNRIDLLNRKHDLQSSITIKDKNEGQTGSSGTLVSITLPLEIKEE